MAGWENLNLKQSLSTPVSHWLLLTWHQINITSPRSICLLRQNNFSQTILGVRNDSITYLKTRKTKTDTCTALTRSKQLFVSCGSVLLVLNMLARGSLLWNRSHRLLQNYDHVRCLCLYHLRWVPRNHQTLLHLPDWGQWSPMSLTQKPPKSTGAKDHSRMKRHLLIDPVLLYCQPRALNCY